MTNTEKGLFYEKGIEFLIRQNPKIYFDNTKIDWNVKLKGKSGVEHQVDILLTTGKILTLVECKNHNRVIGYDVVAKFDSIQKDVNSSNGIIYSASGFSADAREYAAAKSINLESVIISEIIIKSCRDALKKFFPNLDDPPQKYWTIMEQKGNSTTGNCLFFEPSHMILLFFSKAEAYLYCKTGYNVFPVSSEHLRIMKGFAHNFRKNLCVYKNGEYIPLSIFDENS